MRAPIAVAIASFTLACGAAAAGQRGTVPGAAAAAAAPGAAQAPKPRIVCRMEKPTGSNIAQKVCWDQDERDAERIRTQQQVLDLQQRASVQSKHQ